MIVVGVDEVGRGCWAGPLVAGAVILDNSIPGLRDSKRLSSNMRRILASNIEAQALAWGLGWVEPDEIDALGLTLSVRLAMKRALEQLHYEYDVLVIDGNYNFLPEDSRSMAVIKADDSIAAVSAASIIAKVARDSYMLSISTKYPFYGFEKNVGYGTAQHAEMLSKLGVTPIHRKSYKPVQARLLQ